MLAVTYKWCQFKLKMFNDFASLRVGTLITTITVAFSVVNRNSIKLCWNLHQAFVINRCLFLHTLLFGRWWCFDHRNLLLYHILFALTMSPVNVLERNGKPRVRIRETGQIRTVWKHPTTRQQHSFSIVSSATSLSFLLDYHYNNKE